MKAQLHPKNRFKRDCWTLYDGIPAWMGFRIIGRCAPHDRHPFEGVLDFVTLNKIIIFLIVLATGVTTLHAYPRLL